MYSNLISVPVLLKLRVTNTSISVSWFVFAIVSRHVSFRIRMTSLRCFEASAGERVWIRLERTPVRVRSRNQCQLLPFQLWFITIDRVAMVALPHRKCANGPQRNVPLRKRRAGAARECGSSRQSSSSSTQIRFLQRRSGWCRRHSVFRVVSSFCVEMTSAVTTRIQDYPASCTKCTCLYCTPYTQILA